MLYQARNNVIKFFDDYFSMVSEARHEATKGTGLKILTLKQMLQRIPVGATGLKRTTTWFVNEYSTIWPNDLALAL